MTQQDFNCFNPASNPLPIVANPNWKKWMCDWQGKMPSSFSGTWNVYGTPANVCPQMPRTPTAITFSRWKLGPVWNPEHQSYDEILDTGDCGPGNYGFGYSEPADYSVDSGERHLPVAIWIESPLVPGTASLSLQSRAIRVSATQQIGMGGDVVMASTCSANSVYIFALFGTGECLFRLEITGVAF